MYPKRDFRYLITQPDTSEKDLISSMMREPLSEILGYWNQSGKPFQLLPVYQKGIEEAIAKNRYPLYQLEDIKSFPEFILIAINGLKRLWILLRFSYTGESLLIDSIRGQNINISPEDKLGILEIIPYKNNINIVIDNESVIVGVFTSRQAECIYQLTHSLQKMIDL
jgi:hypothetical protein